MPKYAVINVQGSQYKIREGDEIEVSRMVQKEGETVGLNEVLLVVDEGKVKLGKPKVKGAEVKAKVVKQFLGPKLDIFKFKAKTGYRRKTGFRPERTLLKIESITA